MANPSISVDVGGNTARLKREINRVANTPISINVAGSGKSGLSDLPLGRISGDLSQIDKSLAAANARVVAFAASAGAIYAVQSAITSIISGFVNVEKSLADINVILNQSSSGLASFGAGLFDIAANTAQSFSTVAEAATELARQGLGVEETLARTNDALILTRLSGLGAAESVAALTAAINSFSTSGLDSQEIINKFANVDAAFAVSSADLAEAVKRVGSSAQDAGVSFDELIALVTTAQQVTARGGAVIGNSLKTIFTRLGRSNVQELFGQLGLSVEDASGKIKNQVQLLQELASVYDSLPQLQQNEVAEKVGGVFQINILKAALGDLSKEYSIYDSALKTSIASTNEAIQRNEELNKTLSARAAALGAKGQQAAITIAQPLVTPALNNILNIGDLLAKAVNTTDASSIGAKIGKGLLDGIGQFIGGPGLALVTAALAKLFSGFASTASQAFKSILGTNEGAKQQAQLQAQIGAFLSQNSGIYKKLQQGQLSVNTVAQAYIGIINSQTQALQQQAAIARQIAQIIASTPKTVPLSPGGARFYSGFIPNFADPNVMAEKAGARAYGYTPGKVVKERIYDGAGKSFIGYRNLAEERTDFINSDGKKATMIMPPNGFSKDTLTAFSGFIPNFVTTLGNPGYNYAPMRKKSPEPESGYGTSSTFRRIDLGNLSQYPNGVSLVQASPGKPKEVTADLSLSKGALQNLGIKSKGGRVYRAEVLTSGINTSVIKGKLPDTKKRTEESLLKLAGDYAGALGLEKRFTTSEISNSGAIVAAAGTAFETALNGFITSNVRKNEGKRVDFADPSNIRKFFHNIPGMYEAKQNVNPDTVKSTIKKFLSLRGSSLDDIINEKPASQLKEEQRLAAASASVQREIAVYNNPAESTYRRNLIAKKYGFPLLSSGFIPNFADSLNEAIGREQAAGVPKSSVYVTREKQLASSSNPMGLGVFNKRDEPNKAARKAAMSARGFATGYVPNFASGDIELATDKAASSINSFSTAIDSVMMASIFAFGMTNDRVKEAGIGISSFSKDLASGKSAFLKDLQKGFEGFSAEGGRNEIKSLQSEISKFNQKIANLNPNAQSAAIQGAISRYENATKQLASRMDRINYQTRTEGYRQNFQQKGIGYGFLAQALAGGIGGALGGPESKGGAISSLLGNIAGFAGLGASVKGPLGAAIGAAVGALTSIGPVVNAFNTGLQSAGKAAEKAKVAFTDIQNSGQTLLQAGQQLDTISKALSSGESVSYSDYQKAQKDFADAMSKMPVEFQKSITNFDMASLMDGVAKSIEAAGAEAIAAKLSKVGEELGSFDWGTKDLPKAEALGFDIGKYLEKILDLNQTSDLTDKLNMVGDAVVDFGQAIQKAESDYQALLSNASPVASVRLAELDTGYKELEQARRDALKNIITAFEGMGGELPDSLRSASDKLKEALDNGLAGDELESALKGFYSQLQSQIKRMAYAATPPMQVARMDTVSRGFYDNFQKIVNDVTQGLKFTVKQSNAIEIDASRIQRELESAIQNEFSGWLGAEKIFDFKNPLDQLIQQFNADVFEFDETYSRTAFMEVSQAFGDFIEKNKSAIVKGLEQQKIDIFGPLPQFSFEEVTQSFTQIAEALANTKRGMFGIAEGANRLSAGAVETDFTGLAITKINDLRAVLETLKESGADTSAAIAAFDALDEKAQTKALEAVNKIFKETGDAAAAAAATLGVRKQTINLDATIQSLRTQINQMVQKAVSFPRADLTGFKNPFETLNKSLDQAAKNYSQQLASIEQQFMQGMAQSGGDRNTVEQLRQQRTAAIQALNEDYNNTIQQLEEQWKEAEQQSAKEAINIAAASGDEELVKAAIQKYINTIGDNIRQYAKFLGESESKVRQMLTDKLLVENKVQPDDLKAAMNELNTAIQQRREIIENYARAIREAGSNKALAGTLEATRDELLGQLNTGTDANARALQATADALAQLNSEIAASGGNLGQSFSDLGAATQRAVSAINGAINTIPATRAPIPGNLSYPRSAKGFIPNFAKSSDINRTKKLETAISGKPAQYYDKPFPHVRNSSQPTFQSAMRDHGGLKQALKDSMTMQYTHGMQKAYGHIPNFAMSAEQGVQYMANRLAAQSAQYNRAQQERADVCSKVKEKNPELEGAASGFIPNFAQTKKSYEQIQNEYTRQMRDLERATYEQNELKNRCANLYAKQWDSIQLNDLMTLYTLGGNAKYLHIKNAFGYIPNFAGASSISPAEKMMEKTMAKEHGYKAGQVQKRRIWDGRGNSFNSVVNSAEDIFDFINGNGYRATMVVPPNGFANGYSPQIDNPNIDSNLAETLNETSSSANTVSDSFTEIDSEAVVAVNAQQQLAKGARDTNSSLELLNQGIENINSSADSVNFDNLSESSFYAAETLNTAAAEISNFGASVGSAISQAISSSNITVEPQVNVEPPNVSVQPILDTNVTLANPTVQATYNINVAGMAGIDSAVADIKSKISSALSQQEGAIEQISKELSNMSFRIARA